MFILHHLDSRARTHMSLSLKEGVNTDVMKQFGDAKYIYVDLSRDLDFNIPSFDEALYAAIWSTHLPMQEFPKSLTASNFIKELKEKRGTSSIFLVIDEISEVVNLTHTRI